MVIKCKESLIYFEHIDRTAETLTLIVDNYIAGLIKKVRDCNDIESEIKKQKREQLIKNILDNPQLPWNYISISYNPNVRLKDIIDYPQIDWNIEMICLNSKNILFSCYP